MTSRALMAACGAAALTVLSSCAASPEPTHPSPEEIAAAIDCVDLTPAAPESRVATQHECELDGSTVSILGFDTTRKQEAWLKHGTLGPGESMVANTPDEFDQDIIVSDTYVIATPDAPTDLLDQLHQAGLPAYHPSFWTVTAEVAP